ncbi:MAG: lipopolysaccharide biosynthesis protein [Oscillospiraceae bacterium]|nr:lipopolysaccharide biosynthesis protein [Oscillospiraceae bacterium]
MHDSQLHQNNTFWSNIIWKLLERFGVQGVQFIIQIILARLLSPEHYGILSLMIIFTTLANVFIQNGFNTSLIQNKDVTEEDYSSVFWFSLGIAVILYIILFAAAPLVAAFYKMPDIITPFRVISLMLIPGAFNSIQVAKVSREMNFKKVFYSNIIGTVISGMAGIAAAYMGLGLWALVIQTLLNVTVACIVMLFTVNWHPTLVCDLKRIKVLLSYGWKLLVSALLDTLYQDLSSLVIGKKYDSGMLGQYNRGKQFPQFIVNGVNGSIQSVLLPALSLKQEDRKQVKTLMRTSMTLSAYIIFPMMAGLAGIAEPLVSLILTDKWLPCVPYLQIFCFSFAFWPVHTSNLQAINAMGRSDIFLKLEIIKKIYGIAALIIAVFCFDSPIAIAMTGGITSVISSFVNAFPNKKLIDYSYFEQMKDILPSFLLSAVMFGIVVMIGTMNLAPIITLFVQIISGIVFYILFSFILKIRPFVFLLDNFFHRLKG